MKFGIIVTIIVVAISLLLAFTPFIPYTSGFWHADNQQAFNGVLATFVGIEITLYTAAITLITQHQTYRQTQEIQKLVSGFPLTVVRRQTDAQFYSHFRYEAENAEHSVRICYFAPYPPTEIEDRDRKRY